MSEIVLISFGVIIVFFLAVNIKRTPERHIVMVALAVLVYFASSGTVEAEPRFVESGPLPGGEIMSECTDGYAKSGEFEAQKMVNIFRPTNGSGVDIGKLSVKNIPEPLVSFSPDCIGFELTGKFVSKPYTSKSASDSTRNADDSNSEWTYFQLFLLWFASVIVGLIIAVPIAIFLVMKVLPKVFHT